MKSFGEKAVWLPSWVQGGSQVEPPKRRGWVTADADPEVGQNILVRVDFKEALQTADDEEWTSALLAGRLRSATPQRLEAMIEPQSKHCPAQLAGRWLAVLRRAFDEEPWQLQSMKPLVVAAKPKSRER